MRKVINFILIISIIFTNSIILANTNPIIYTTEIFNINQRDVKVNIVTIDLNNEDIELNVEISNDIIGGDEDFNSFIERKNIDAAINANYFDAYDTLEPYGTIMKEGKIIYLEGKNTSMAITKDNEVIFDRFKTVIKGNLDGKLKNEWNHKKQEMDFYLFDAWYVNNKPVDTTGVYIYTPERGENIELEGGTAVVVKDNKVNKILKNVETIEIPSNGFIIYYATNSATDEYIDKRFKIGRTVNLKYQSIYSSENTKEDENKPEPPKELLKLYGCVDKITKNYWDNRKNGMDFNIFNVWYINNNPIDPTGVYLYTPEKGNTLKVPEGNAIIVENGIIKDIIFKTNEIKIPSNGFVLYYGINAADEKYLKDRFSIGKTVDFYHYDTKKIDTENIIKDAVYKYRYALYENNTTNLELSDIDLNKVKSLISAGPYLIKEGKIIVDPEKEGFKEDKITKNKANRSAIGLTKDNKLLLVTTSNVTINELAEIMYKLNTVEAMNLDGGASSGLYANGKIITKPSRKLSTVLAIYNKNNKPIEERIRNNELKNINKVKHLEKELLNYTVNKFTDINNNDWFVKTVSYLVGMNIIAGYKDNTFKPNDKINVDAFIKMTIAALGYSVQLSEGYWAQNYINKAFELGLIKENEFDKYNRPITRAEMARIIIRAINETPKYNLNELKIKVKDLDNLDESLKEDVLKAYGLGIISGYGNGKFKPLNTATRAEASSLIIRMLDTSLRTLPNI